MNTQLLLDLLGYGSSIIVLISFLMSSVVKLRIINSIGCIVFIIFAVATKSYPTAFLNVCLVGVNIYYLIKLRKSDKHYSLVEGKPEDAFLQYFLKQYKDDIAIYFPGVHVANEDVDVAYITCCNGVPAGVLVGVKKEEGTVEVVLDYTTPEYRDCSVGAYLYEQLPSLDVKKLCLMNASDKHASYLTKMGFAKVGNAYVKNLD